MCRTVEPLNAPPTATGVADDITDSNLTTTNHHMDDKVAPDTNELDTSSYALINPSINSNTRMEEAASKTHDLVLHDSVSGDDPKTNLVRSLLTERAEIVLEMADRQEAMNQQTESAIPSLAASIPTAPNAPTSTTTTERTKLTPGNFLASFIPPRLIGMTYLALSAIILSIQVLFVSIVSKSMPSFQIVMFRCLLQFTFAFIACRRQGINVFGPADRRKWLWVRGMMGCAAFSAYYFALSRLTLADATTIFFTAPLYTGVFGFLFLGEALVKFDICCTLASFAGVIMVVRPVFLFGATVAATTVGTSDGDGSNGDASDPNVNTGSGHLAGVLIAILGSLLSSLVYICIRKVGPGVNPLVLVAYMGMCGVLVGPWGGIFQTFHWPADAGVWFSILGIGVFAFVGQILFNAGVQREKAGISSMVRNLDVFFSFLLQIVVQGITPNIWSVFGALIVSASVVAVGIKKMYTKEPTPAVPSATTTPAAVRKLTDQSGVSLHELAIHAPMENEEKEEVDEEMASYPKPQWH